MSYKWNENSTLIFLNAYKKYPCLWNPYNVKYYNCLAKNEALKNIIKELDIPELNISDCLEQIKVIREKYGQEQMRIIEGFQSQKPYKSSLAWLSVISEMLAKVIVDEDKLQNEMRSMKTVSPSILKSCVTPYKYKNIINFPCAQETKQDYKIKHRKNTKFTKIDKEIYLKKDLAILNARIKGRNNTGLLQCPSCGWEDINSEKLDVTSKKICEQTKSLDITVPCPKYTDLADKPYEGYNAYRTGINTYCGRYDTIPCPSFSHNLSSYTSYPANILPITTHSYRPQFQGTHNYISPLAKQAGRSVEHRNEGIQNTICVSKTNVTPLYKCATMLQIPNHAVIDSIGKCHKEVQAKPFVEELKQVATNTVERCDKGIQSTICMSRGSNNCQAFEKCSSTIQESKQVDRKTVQCPEDMQNVIGIKFKTVECSVPNFLLISSDGNCVSLKQTDFKLKRSTTDKCQNTDLCQDQKEAEKVCVKGTCSRDAIEIIKHNSTLTQALLQCLEKIIPLQEKTKTHSVPSLALKKDDVNSDSFETTICEPNDIHFATSSAIELGSPSCLPCLKETEKDNVIAMFIKTFLELMEHALVSNNRKRTENTQEKCVRKENAIDTFIILNKIKECADKILKLYTAANCSKKSNQFCPRYKSKSEDSPEASLNLNSIQAQVSENSTDQFTAFYENSKDVEVLYRPRTPNMRDHPSSDLPENQITFVEAAVEEKPSVKDKEITAHSENHDIDVTVSLPSASLRDSGTQYTPKQLQDTGVVTEQSFEEKISVGTQDESVLIRIIKCNNSGALMFDKETCVRDAHVECTKNRTATCPVLSSRLSENRIGSLYRKCLIRECYNEELLHPGISHIHEQEMNCIDYRKSSLTNNYRYDRQWRSSLPYNQDWRKVNIPILGLSSHQRASRIPLYTKSHKYTRRRIDRYKMSQSYM